MTSPPDDASAELWRRAASFSARAHQGQMRKDGVTPYAAHPARVALTLGAVFGCDDPAALAAALLHDVIEDCGVDYDDLAEQFGDRVARCVAALSKDPRLPEPLREPAYDEQLRRADWRAKLVKLADVYDNFCDRFARADTPDIPKLARRCARAISIAQSEPDPPAALSAAIRCVQDLVAAAEGTGT